MLSTLQRFLPFFNREGNSQARGTGSGCNNSIKRVKAGVSKGQHLTTNHQYDGVTTTDDESDSCWSTLSQRKDNDEREFKRGSRFEALNARRTKRSVRSLLSGGLFSFWDEFVINEDISNGHELNKIPAISYRRDDKAPNDYHYVTEHVHIEPTNLNDSLNTLVSCKCNGCDCLNGKCDCSLYHKKGRCYNSKGRLSSSYNIEAPEVIRECNLACKCNRKTCKNRVIQNGCKAKLVLFRTKSRGWGVRTLETLARGTFVGVYSGELISTTDSHTRTDDTYLFNLTNTQIYYQDEQPSSGSNSNDANQQQEQVKQGQQQKEQELAKQKQEQKQQEQPIKQEEQQQQQQQQQFVCDAKFYGNFTRFINHSCDPNVIGIRSYTVHNDERFPYIAFFVRKEIAANAELTLNYGDNYWLVKCKRDGVYCLCKQPNCRFSKKTFSRTSARRRAS